MLFRCTASILLGSCLLAAAAAGPANNEQKIHDEATLKEANLGTDAPALLAFFKKHTIGDTDPERIKQCIADLGDDSFAVREKANEQLISYGPAARLPLREAARSSDVEVAVRAARTLEQIEKEGGPQIVAACARLLADLNPNGATEALLAYVPAAEDQVVVDEVARSLVIVGFRSGKTSSALVDALTDKLAVRRAVAAEALCRAGGATERPLARKLLQDADAMVRLRTALAFFDTHDKEAIPVLISLLVELPRDQVWRAEDALYVVSGDKAPAGSMGPDELSRREYRNQWQQWWQENGKDIDLAKLEGRQKQLGLTLLALMENRGQAMGRVEEIDATGKVKWQIEGLKYPIDAQMIGDDRVLVSEYTSRTVTERTLKGEVKWTKTLSGFVLGARRLANGNTFIVARNAVMVVDKEGKEVATVNRANDIAAGTRLRNGDFAIVTNLGQFIRMTPDGKEVKSFPVGQVLNIGSNIEVQPSGRVLVPLYNMNKVVEYDAEGKQLWETPVTLPTSVTRLPNGNILVASRNTRTVFELDRNGKEVWKHMTDGMPMRASRR
jgi:HEAT repeat protein